MPSFSYQRFLRGWSRGVRRPVDPRLRPVSLRLEELETRTVPSISVVQQHLAAAPNTATTFGQSQLVAGDSDGTASVEVSNPTQPANAALSDNHNGTFTFTPNAGFTGSTSFTFSVAAAAPQAELSATDGAANDRFGDAVALDGTTAVIGAVDAAVNGQADQGAVYVFVLSGSTWTLQAELTASDGATNDLFGRSVSVSGDTLVVGAEDHAVSGQASQGAAYVFVRSGSTWSQQAELTASDGNANDFFGQSVSVSGGMAVVGASGHAVGSNANQGESYVFVSSGGTWTQQAELTAADGAANNAFGSSVALDGSTAVIGANAKTVSGHVNQGAAYVFVGPSGTWTQQAELIAVDGGPNDNFGRSLAVSGTTILVGAAGHTVNGQLNQGAAYVFVSSSGTWVQQAELTASDGAANNAFGASVALDGGTAVIGATNRTIGGNVDQGVGYTFAQSGSLWFQQAEFTAADGAANDFFGNAVAVSGTTLLVGADGKTVGANVGQGVAYVLTLDTATGSALVTVNPLNPSITANSFSADTTENTATTLNLLAHASDAQGGALAVTGTTSPANATLVNNNNGTVTFTPNTGFIGSSSFTFTVASAAAQAELTAADGTANTQFGFAVAVSGNTAVIGAPGTTINNHPGQGAVYVFVQANGTWTLQAKLTASDGTTSDEFGQAVSVSGDTLVVGVNVKTVNANLAQGVAYVFVRSGTTWSQQAQLTAADGARGDLFGAAVALDGDTAVIGAPDKNDSGAPDQGTAYVFVRSGTTWSQQAELLGANSVAFDFFGQSVSVSGDTVVVGASGLAGGGNTAQGAAYVFVRTATIWSQQAELTASDGAANDMFGGSVSVSGDTAVIGASGHAVGGKAGQGAAYVFARSTGTWMQQAELTASDGAANDAFGSSVAVSGTTIIVGAKHKTVSGQADHGAAYEFVSNGSVWTQAAEFTASDGGAGDFFGSAVSVSGPATVLGALDHMVNGNSDQGAAYVQEVGSGTATVTVNVNAAVDKLGAYRASNGSWSLDSDSSPGFNSATDQVFFSFSPANVTGVAGDWNGSGSSKIGDFKNGVWHLDLNGNGVLDSGEMFTYGQAGDQPVVGDWTGDGVDNIGVFRAASDGITGEFILDTNGDHILDAGDETFTFGLATDRIVIGDWNGAGKDEVGVFRNAVSFNPADAGDAIFSLDTNNNHTFDAGDQVFIFGLITDGLIVGDWNGAGKTEVGVYRDGSTAPVGNALYAPGTALFSLDTNGNLGFDSGDQVFLYGLESDQFVAGHWAKTPPLQPEGTPQAQYAANGQGPGAAPLTEAQLAPVLQQAIAAWVADGASATQLDAMQVQIGPLHDNLVGLTEGKQITLDATADGWGWNTDTSNTDFTSTSVDGLEATPGSAAAGKMDLLTVVEHELGHELGLSDVDPATHPSSLMASSLPVGTRRTIGSRGG